MSEQTTKADLYEKESNEYAPWLRALFADNHKGRLQTYSKVGKGTTTLVFTPVGGTGVP